MTQHMKRGSLICCLNASEDVLHSAQSGRALVEPGCASKCRASRDTGGACEAGIKNSERRLLIFPLTLTRTQPPCPPPDRSALCRIIIGCFSDPCRDALFVGMFHAEVRGQRSGSAAPELLRIRCLVSFLFFHLRGLFLYTGAAS